MKSNSIFFIIISSIAALCVGIIANEEKDATAFGISAFIIIYGIKQSLDYAHIEDNK